MIDFGNAQASSLPFLPLMLPRSWLAAAPPPRSSTCPVNLPRMRASTGPGWSASSSARTTRLAAQHHGPAPHFPHHSLAPHSPLFPPRASQVVFVPSPPLPPLTPPSHFSSLCNTRWTPTRSPARSCGRRSRSVPVFPMRLTTEISTICGLERGMNGFCTFSDGMLAWPA